MPKSALPDRTRSDPLPSFSISARSGAVVDSSSAQFQRDNLLTKAVQGSTDAALVVPIDQGALVPGQCGASRLRTRARANCTATGTDMSITVGRFGLARVPPDADVTTLEFALDHAVLRTMLGGFQEYHFDLFNEVRWKSVELLRGSTVLATARDIGGVSVALAAPQHTFTSLPRAPVRWLCAPRMAGRKLSRKRSLFGHHRVPRVDSDQV